MSAVRRVRGVLPALVACVLGATTLLPAGAALAAPAASAGLGTVVADLGVVTQHARPGFSASGRYYAYLVADGDRCDLRLWDVTARRPVDLAPARVVCDSFRVDWAAAADTLVWQVEAGYREVREYAWDAASGRTEVLAPDAHVYAQDAQNLKPAVSADGRFVALTAQSETHPAPAVDYPRTSWFVYDRASRVSLPLSRPDLHVQFTGWGPTGARFVGRTGGHSTDDHKTGTCFGTGSACRTVLESPTIYSGASWSPDGTEVTGGPGAAVHDFSDDSTTAFPDDVGVVGYAAFLDDDRLLGGTPTGTALWDRTTGNVTAISTPSGVEGTPGGRYLLYRDVRPGSYRYRNVVTGASAASTYRGTDLLWQSDGYWTRDGTTWLGVGPGGCSSLRQWSPASNTVSLYTPPGTGDCYRVPVERENGPLSSASGRFALVDKELVPTNRVADLRRHVLLAPVDGVVDGFAPAGSDVMVVLQGGEAAVSRLLLVDPTPVPDVDDVPRWSSATPANGVRVEVAPGGRVQVEIGASEPQGAPVNLFFRWRDTAGTPIASAPLGWSCARTRLAGGATRALCTFAPPETGWTATRFLDVSATNHLTGAQSGTRSYRVAVAR